MGTLILFRKKSMNDTTTAATVSSPGQQQNLYQLYGSAGFSPDLVTNVGIRWICATVAALANFSVFYVTAKCKNLRTPCNKLIALDSLYAGFYELSVTITFAVVLSGQNFIHLSSCWPLQVLPLLGFFLSQGGTLSIAVDRLLCMLFPIWINKNQEKHNKLLVPAMVTACLAYALYALALCIEISLRNAKKFVQCGTGDCFPDEVGDFLNTNQLYLLALSVGCYPLILLAVILRKKTANVTTVSYTRKMFKSLFAIILVLLASQALASISRLLGLQPSSASSGIGFYLANGQVCLKYLAYGCNGPILYATSSEYRKAYNSVLFGRETSGSTVQVMSTSNGNGFSHRQPNNDGLVGFSREGSIQR